MGGGPAARCPAAPRILSRAAVPKARLSPLHTRGTSLVRGTGGHRPVSQSNQIEDPCGHEVALASPGTMGLCAFIWPNPTCSSMDALGTARRAPAVPGGHNGACLSCGECTTPGDVLFWKAAHSPRGCGNGGTAWGSCFSGGGGHPMKNAALRLGKGCRGTTSSCSRLSVGLHRLRDPGLTVPAALLPAGCLPPTDVQSRAASWLHSVPHKSSLRTGVPELPLLSFSSGLDPLGQ